MCLIVKQRHISHGCAHVCVVVVVVCTLCCGVSVGGVWCGVVWCFVLCGVVRLGMRKTPSMCEDSRSLRVCVQDASVCTGKTPACSTHAGVFRVHTEAS